MRGKAPDTNACRVTESTKTTATSGGRREDDEARAAPSRRARRRAAARGSTRCSQFSSAPQRVTTTSASVLYGGSPAGRGCQRKPPDALRCSGQAAHLADAREQLMYSPPSAESNQENVGGFGHDAGCVPHDGPLKCSRECTPRPNTHSAVRTAGVGVQSHGSAAAAAGCCMLASTVCPSTNRLTTDNPIKRRAPVVSLSTSRARPRGERLEDARTLFTPPHEGIPAICSRGARAPLCSCALPSKFVLRGRDVRSALVSFHNAERRRRVR